MESGPDAAAPESPLMLHLPIVVIALLGAVLLLVANTVGAGEFHWRYLLYFALIALLALAALHVSHRRKFHMDKAFIAAFSCFVLLLAVSALTLIWGRSTYDGVQELFLLGSFLIAFLLGYMLLRRRDRLWLFMGLITVVAVSLCAWGLWQYFKGFSDLLEFLGRHGFNYVITDRVNSNFLTPNIFASFLNMSIPIALAMILVERQRALRYLWCGALSLQLLCLYLTQSRGGWLVFGLVVVLVVFTVPKAWWKEKWRLLAVVIVVAVVAIFLCSLYSPLDSGAEAYGGETSGEEYSGLDVTAAAGSMRGRMGIWRGGLDMFAHNLGGGVGVGSYGLAMQQYQYRAYYSIHAHNYFLETGAETGIVGLIPLLVLSIMVVWRLRKIYRRKLSGDGRVMAVALWALAVGFLVHNLIDIAWFNPLAGAVFWLCAGALFAVTGISDAEFNEEPLAWKTEGGGEIKSSDTRPGWSGALRVVAAVVLVALVVLSGYLMTLYFLSGIYGERGDEEKDFGEFRTAIEEYESALKYIETDPSTQFQLAYIYRVLFTLGEEPPQPEVSVEMSMAHIDRAVELEPEDAFKHNEKGILLIILKEYEESRESLREAQRLYPNNPNAFYNEGESYFEEGMYEDAEGAYMGAFELLPYYADPCIVPFRERQEFDVIMRSVGRLIDIKTIQGDFEGAIEIIDQAISELPESGKLYYQRAFTEKRMGKWEEALADLRKSLEVNPNAGGVHLEMGRIYLEMGEPGKAEEEFLLELEGYPDSQSAQEELDSLQGGGDPIRP
ncbi:MAG: O-antigen ligase family protein [Actinomycetota bacterium]|nr:O-antigen ligase family protein [Actinomycetota bacterium]